MLGYYFIFKGFCLPAVPSDMFLRNAWNSLQEQQQIYTLTLVTHTSQWRRRQGSQGASHLLDIHESGRRRAFLHLCHSGSSLPFNYIHTPTRWPSYGISDAEFVFDAYKTITKSSQMNRETAGRRRESN